MLMTIHGHKMNAIERMNIKLKTGLNGCWEWQGKKQVDGYGIMRDGNKNYLVHRLMWLIRKGDIPKDYQIDHLCKNRKCSNPDHLEAVPGSINNARSGSCSAINARKTHCLRGHALEGENLRIIKDKTGKHRKCRQCHREYLRTWMEKHSKTKACV